MTTPVYVATACNGTTPDQLSQDGLLFDLGERFEKWLRSLQRVTTSPPNHFSLTRQEENPPASFYLESFPGSDCQVSFEGVLHIEGHLAGNIRSFNGTLVMPEQVKIEADIEVGVALINGSVIGEHHPESAGRAPAPGSSRREYQNALLFPSATAHL